MKRAAMIIDRVEFLVEEPSMAAALRGLLPRILGATSYDVHDLRCKSELLRRLPSRLRGYAAWIPASWRIVVIVDRDGDDCSELKARLEQIALDAGVATKSAPRAGRFILVNRIAIEELEAWFFGDWAAVRSAYPKVEANVPSQAAYRHSDAVAGGTWEALERILQAAGYFAGGLGKVTAARAIAEQMDPARNTSPSFRALRDVLLPMASR